MNLYILLFALVAAKLSSSSFVMESREERPKRVYCYFESGALTRIGKYSFGVTELVDGAKLCTHILYAFVGLDDKRWSVLILNPKVDMGALKLVSSLPEKIPGLKIVLSMGGWGEDGRKYSEMVSKKTRRRSVIQSIIMYMNKYDFDAFDLDWEYPGEPERGGSELDKANLILFFEELKEAFLKEGKGWEISMAVPLNQKTLEKGYDIKQLCSLLDAVNLMAYDLRGPWNGFTDVHSPLVKRPFDTGVFAIYNVEDGTQNWIDSGCESEKLILGVPFYGKGYKLLSNESNCLMSPCETGSAVGFSYYQICEEIDVKDSKWTCKFDSVGKAPYAYLDTDWQGYENLKSLKYKIDFALSKQLGGMMMWAMDLDDYKGRCSGQTYPMLRTIHDSLIARIN